MNRRELILSASALSLVPGVSMAAPPTPPIVRKDPKRIEQLGRVRVTLFELFCDHVAARRDQILA